MLSDNKDGAVVFRDNDFARWLCDGFLRSIAAVDKAYLNVIEVERLENILHLELQWLVYRI